MILVQKGNKIYIILLLILLINNYSCYKEYSIIPEYKSNVFNFILDPDNEISIYGTMGETFEILPTPLLYYGEFPYKLDHFSIRGQSATSVRRKSYSVNMNGQFFIPQTDSTPAFSTEKFKLLALAFDYTYIENRLSHLFLSEAGLWSLKTFFTEIMLNNNPQGIYMFVEDPVEYSFKKGADIIIRRYYNHVIAKAEINSSPGKSLNFYTEKFNHLYELIAIYSGKQLYDSLNHHMNMQNYMRKMAVDMVLANGDYTDEVFFYSVPDENNNIIFDFIPWDYDDIFSILPHEVGRSWAVGQVFGPREYNTAQDIQDELNGRLIFSIEDDIDYIISKDDYLYEKYLENLDEILQKYDTLFVQNSFDLLYKELIPFYEKTHVIEQSAYDWNETNLEIFIQNLENKKNYLIDRIHSIGEKLITQKSLINQ